MVKGIRLRVMITVIMGMSAFMVVGSAVTPALAQREARIYEDVASFSPRVLRPGDSTSWSHNGVPASVLDPAIMTRAGIIVRAEDIDYPPSRSCQCNSAATCENDQLYVNGSNVGRLEGCNTGGGDCPPDCDQPVADEMIVRESVVQTDNEITVRNESSGNWVVTVLGGEFYVYGVEDFDISATPDSRTVDATDTATYQVGINWIGVWENSVALSVSGLPSGATASFSPNPVSADGQTSTMTVTLSNAAPGTYLLTIMGSGTADYADSGGSRNVVHTTEVTLIVGEGEEEPPEGFQLITANPDYIELEPGQTVESKIIGYFIGDCQGPISIDIIGSRLVVDATGRPQFERTDQPEAIKARLLRTELTPSDRGATLEMRAGREMEPGEYDVVVSGIGCGLSDQQVSVTLAIKAADLKITKRQSQSTVKPNMVQIYTIRVVNEGRAPATNVVVTDTLSGGLTYVSDTASDAVHSENDGQHRWAFSKPLKPGGSFSFNINARVNPFIRSGVSISNRAEVTADQAPEPILSNTVTAVSGFEAVQPDGLKVTKRALKRDARVGGILTYRIEVENVSSAGPIFDIVLKDRLPSGFKIPNGKSVRDGSRYSDPQRSGRTYSWRLGNLGPGDRTVLTYQAVVGTNAASGRNENTAIAAGVDGGGNRVSGSDSALIMLGAGDLEEPSEIVVSVYNDTNRNEIFDSADMPMKDIEVILVPPGLKQMTNEDGETIYFDLTSGQYMVAVNELILAEDNSVVGASSQLVRLIEGESADVSFLLSTDPGYGKLIARVFVDTNQNGEFDRDENSVQEFTALLDAKVKSKTQKGVVVFSRIEPGKHNVIIQVGIKELSKEVDIQPGRNTIDIPIPESRLRIKIRQSGS